MKDQKLKKTGTSNWQRTFAGGHENRDPSVTLIGVYISDDARSCVNDDCFDCRPFQIANFSQEKSPILEISHLLLLKGLHYVKN